MKLSAPKMVTWIIALVVGVIGLLATLVALPVISASVGVWLVFLALVLMLVATMVTGL